MDAQIAEAGPNSALILARAEARLDFLREQILPTFEDTSQRLHCSRKDLLRDEFRRIFEFLRDHRPERSVLFEIFDASERLYLADPENPAIYDFKRVFNERPQGETILRGIFDSYKELEFFEEFMSELRSRQNDTVFRPEFESFAVFMTELRRQQSETSFRPEFGTREEFTTELDCFEEFMSALLQRHESETVYRPDFSWLDELKSDLVSFEEFMFDLRRRHNKLLICPEFNREVLFDHYFVRRSGRIVEENLRWVDDNLPAVETATLPEDGQSCPICWERYDDTSSSTAAIISEGDPEKEPAIRLRCNHVVGKFCLRSFLKGGNTTCPCCRAYVFVPHYDTSDSTLDM